MSSVRASRGVMASERTSSQSCLPSFWARLVAVASSSSPSRSRRTYESSGSGSGSCAVSRWRVVNGEHPLSAAAIVSSSGTCMNSKVDCSPSPPLTSGAAIMNVLSRGVSTSDVRQTSTVSKRLAGRTKPPARRREPLLACPYEMKACSPLLYARVATTIKHCLSSSKR